MAASNVAAKDGSVIAHFAHTALFEPLFGKGTGRFDAAKFTWIGNMDAVVGVCGVWDHAGITPFDELLTREMVVGAGGAGTSGPLTQFATAVRRLLGAKLKLIQGYKGSAEIRLALARGELQGVCGIPISTLKTEWKTTGAPGASRSSSSSGATATRTSPVSRTYTTTPRRWKTGRCST